MPKGNTGKPQHELLLDLIMAIAEQPGIYGIDLCKMFPQESHSRVYRLVREAREAGLIEVTDYNSVQYEHNLTKKGADWLYGEGLAMITLAQKIKQVCDTFNERKGL